MDTLELVRNDERTVFGLGLLDSGLDGGSVVARFGLDVSRQGRDGGEEGEGSKEERCGELHIEFYLGGVTSGLN